MTDTTSKTPKPTPASGPSRRTVLGGMAGLTAATALGSFTIVSRKADAATPLRILCWPGYEEKDVIGEFEERIKNKVEFKIYIGGEQMLQFFAQTPRGTFDAIISDAEYVQKLKGQKAVEAFSTADMPQMANYHPKFRDFEPVKADDGLVYGVPTRFSFYGISYNTDVLSAEESLDWNSLFLPKLTGKIGVFDWYLPNMGNASLAVMPNNQTPYAIDDAQLAKVKDWLLKLRPQVSMFGSSGQPLAQAMIAGDIVAAPMGDLDIDLKLAGYDNFESTIPNQGGIRWQEVATLCADSKNKDLAMQWITYMTEPQVQSKLVYTKAFKARAPNMKVVDFWNEDQKKLLGYVPDPKKPGTMLVEELIDRSIPRGLPTMQPERAWIDIFNEFKTSA